MLELGEFAIALCLIIGVLAGIIEATAGGSGLIIIPTLLMLGLSPTSAMATSKLQYVFGAISSITRFHRAKLLQTANILPLLLAAGTGGALGSLALSRTNPDFLAAIIPLLLIAATLYFIFSPRLSDRPSPTRMKHRATAIGIMSFIGFYDGFFGVGSGSFYVLALIWGWGFAAREATATTKLVDFTSAAAALAVLLGQHEVRWDFGLWLGCGQIIGAWIGASLVIRHGSRFIRPLLVAVSLGLSLKLLYDYRTTILSWLS